MRRRGIGPWIYNVLRTVYDFASHLRNSRRWPPGHQLNFRVYLAALITCIYVCTHNAENAQPRAPTAARR